MFISDPRRIHLTDTYTVTRPTLDPYTIEANLNYESTQTDSDIILAEARSSVYRYIDSRERLGQSIRLDGIRSALYVDNVETVSITKPAMDLPSIDGKVYVCNKDETDVVLTATVI